jgi:hypothetical protein
MRTEELDDRATRDQNHDSSRSAFPYVCVLCNRDWPPEPQVPTAYTIESIAAELPPEVVCDHCIEDRYPEATFAELMAERQRFLGELSSTVR